MKKFISRNWREVIGALVGGIAGLAYWRFVGCSSGQCAITSHPLNSTIYGAVMGGLLASAFKKNRKEAI